MEARWETTPGPLALCLHRPRSPTLARDHGLPYKIFELCRACSSSDQCMLLSDTNIPKTCNSFEACGSASEDGSLLPTAPRQPFSNFRHLTPRSAESSSLVSFHVYRKSKCAAQNLAGRLCVGIRLVRPRQNYLSGCRTALTRRQPLKTRLQQVGCGLTCKDEDIRPMKIPQHPPSSVVVRLDLRGVLEEGRGAPVTKKAAARAAARAAA